MAEKIDQYMGLILDGDSPFNNRSATPYRQAVLGVMKEPYCAAKVEIGYPTDVAKISNLAVQPRMPFSCPATTQHKKTVKVNAPFELKHGKVKGYTLLSVTYIMERADVFIRDEKQFAALIEGEHKLTVIDKYDDGYTCEHTYEITVKASKESEEN